jgi:hypothetical protein
VIVNVITAVFGKYSVTVCFLFCICMFWMWCIALLSYVLLSRVPGMHVCLSVHLSTYLIYLFTFRKELGLYLDSAWPISHDEKSLFLGRSWWHFCHTSFTAHRPTDNVPHYPKYKHVHFILCIMRICKVFLGQSGNSLFNIVFQFPQALRVTAINAVFEESP